MVDAITAGLCAIGFGFLVSAGSMSSAVWFNSRNMYIWGHVVSVIVFGGGSTFIIAYAKAYFNRPTVNVGKSSLEAEMYLCSGKETRMIPLLTLFCHCNDTTYQTSVYPVAHHDLGDPHQGGYPHPVRGQHDESFRDHNVDAVGRSDIDPCQYLPLAGERAREAEVMKDSTHLSFKCS